MNLNPGLAALIALMAVWIPTGLALKWWMKKAGEAEKRRRHKEASRPC